MYIASKSRSSVAYCMPPCFYEFIAKAYPRRPSVAVSVYRAAADLIIQATVMMMVRTTANSTEDSRMESIRPNGDLSAASPATMTSIVHTA